MTECRISAFVSKYGLPVASLATGTGATWGTLGIGGCPAVALTAGLTVAGAVALALSTP